MQWLRKVRNGAYFVDILLVIAALIAIIGLATFVHLRSGKAPKAFDKKATINTSAEHIAYASPTPDNSGPPSGQGGKADVNGASTSDKTSADPESASEPPLISRCNEPKKTELVDNYHKAITKENNRYQSELAKKQSLLGLVGAALQQTMAILLNEHKSLLNQLNLKLDTDLAAINCQL